MSKIKKLCYVMVLVLMFPFVTILAGCGPTPSSEITGIVFDTMIYEDGVAVFEVDQGVTTDLTYKIFPSTASGYKVYFDPIDKGTPTHSSRFTFDNGKITIDKPEFEDVKYKVRVGDFTDTCIIRLKKYPNRIYTTDTDIMLNTNDVKVINVMAEFENSPEPRSIREDEYDFLVETSDETIIHIPNENYLKIIPIRNGLASAKVTVTLLNKQKEKTGLSFELNVRVVQNISDAKVIMTGVEHFVKDGDEVEVDYSALGEIGSKEISFEVYPVNKNNILDQHGHEYIVTLTSQNYMSVSEDGKKIILKESIEEGYKMKVSLVHTDLNMQDGSTFVVRFTITIVNVNKGA